MSGVRLYSFREGDRSEYLANYLLSGLGLITAIPRQEDIGFDFNCQLADQENGILTFGYPFIIQIKSDHSSVVYGSENPDKWESAHVNWFNRIELPLFFGIVNKKELKLEIFNCSSHRFSFVRNNIPSIIEFIPRKEFSENEVKAPIKKMLNGWPEGRGDKQKHFVDLGNPIVTISNDDLYNPELLSSKKKILRNVIVLEQKNILYKKLDLPHFHWILKNKTNEEIVDFAWAHFSVPYSTLIEDQLNSIGPFLISFAYNAGGMGRTDIVEILKPLLRILPEGMISDVLINNAPGVFKV